MLIGGINVGFSSTFQAPWQVILWSMPGCARAYLDDMEKAYKSQINGYNGELKRFGFELAEPGDPAAFMVKRLCKTDTPKGGDHE